MPFDRTNINFGYNEANAKEPKKLQTNDTQKKKERMVEFVPTKPKYKMSSLIVSGKVRDELSTVIAADKCWQKVFVDWGLSSVMSERRSLFINLYGYPGTGKTMAAHAIASELRKNIICVNYAEIESKYVGETSKNLTALFKFASETNAVIFFDEADAFLSKRVTNMNNSTDVSVNQTRSVLLTLLNDYSGMVIFATNFITNYDAAFMRRIQYHIKFELPDAELRTKLWSLYIPERMPVDLSISELARKYSNISGSDISTAVLKAALNAARKGLCRIPQSYFESAIESIINSKEANSGCKIETREVSEEYALSQIKKSEVST